LIEAVIEASSDIIIITDPRGIVLIWNSGAERFLGYDKEEIKGKNILDIIVNEQGEVDGEDLKRRLKKKKRVENYRCFYKRKDGVTEPVLLTVNIVYNKRGRACRIVGIAKSIRREMELEAILQRKNQELELLSITDHLTGVSNKRFFDARIEEDISRARQLGYPLALLFVDFDELKKVNTEFGHPAGDAVLVAIARTITELVKGTTDVVARYGGDEFCVIAPGAKKGKAREIAERIRGRIQALRFQSGGRSFSVTVSIGIAELSHALNTSWKLIKAADAAAREAKRLGKNRIIHADNLSSGVTQV
jgi:diguanylate cyclase (GGDEF)-like protein/PAS domain S-box-containing protein